MINKILDFKVKQKMSVESHFIETATIYYKNHLNAAIINLDNANSIDCILDIFPHILDYEM